MRPVARLSPRRFRFLWNKVLCGGGFRPLPSCRVRRSAFSACNNADVESSRCGEVNSGSCTQVLQAARHLHALFPPPLAARPYPLSPL